MCLLGSRYKVNRSDICHVALNPCKCSLPPGEFVPGFEASTWQGIGAPKNTPAEIVDELNKLINAALADGRIKARLADFGSIPTPMSPAAFEELIVTEAEKWAKAVRAANIKLQ